MIRQEEKALKEVGSRKTAVPRDEVSIAKDKRGETSGSLTTEGSKERLCKSNKEEDAPAHDMKVGANAEGAERVFRCA